MKLYRYMPLNRLPHALDIILNSRLYCAEWRSLNDPMEGKFSFSFSSVPNERAQQTFLDIINEKFQLRVCSLSKISTNRLLWAHYASGFSGLAVEVDLDISSPSVHEIDYRDGEMNILMMGNINARQQAESILCTKNTEWKYEDEVRVISSKNYFNLTHPVERIIVGHLMDRAVLIALMIVCEKMKITMERITIVDGKIDIESFPSNLWPQLLASSH